MSSAAKHALERGVRRGLGWVIVSVIAMLWSPWPAAGQGPGARWRTFETTHFRVHYTAPAEAWARHAVSRLESVREEVAREVGYEPEQVVDVVIADPNARANGMAWPILSRPRMVLWTSPPGPSSVIGHYRDWGELLLIHEEVHLAHLLRPSRNPLERWTSRWVPIGPIARRGPRWLSEGYATYLEGKLTGYGRPHSDLRAVVLRRWAQLGELPSYGRLAADSESWLGMSMAYLVGSAYLEWLVEREGPESLRQLWARMSARQVRSFDAAFAGVFGEVPAKLYNRFRAELTYRAMKVEEAVEPYLVSGELWQDLAWTTGSPAVSPDGSQLAIVLRSPKEPSRLVVWSVEPDEEAEKAWHRRREEIAASDPDDVASTRRKPLLREPLYSLSTPYGGEPYSPRWLPDGRALLYVRYEPDAEGFLHPDLFRWDLDSGQVRRLTREADVREPDLAPNGNWAVAVRHRHGLSQLVRVELESGKIEPLTPAVLGETYHRPQLSPDSARLAFVHHSEGAWRLMVRELTGGGERQLMTPPRSTVAHPAWAADGKSIFAAVGEDGFIDIRRFEAESGASRQVIRSHGASLSPEPVPDGQGLFYLSLEADGLDLKFLDFAATHSSAVPEIVAFEDGLEPTVRVEPDVESKPIRLAEVEPSRPYGLGQQEFFPLLSGAFSPSGRGWELGLRSGDVVGRLEMLALASDGDGVPRGGSVSVVWRGLTLGRRSARRGPLTASLRLFALEERPSEQPTPVPGLGRRLDLDREGLEVGLGWEVRRRRSALHWEAGTAWSEIEKTDSVSVDRNVAFLRLNHRLRQRLGSWRFEQGLGLLADWGRTGGDSWNHAGARLRLAVGNMAGTLEGAWSRRRVEGADSAFDRLQLGGSQDSLLPRSALGGRVIAPALPAGTLLGDDYEGQRLALRSGSGPITVFYERHRLWEDAEPQGQWLALRGAELEIQRKAMPLLRLPAFDLSLGVAEILDQPFAGEWETWITFSWRLEPRSGL